MDYICNDCNHLFDDDTVAYMIDDLGMSYEERGGVPGERICICPKCGSNDFAEAQICPVCGKAFSPETACCDICSECLDEHLKHEEIAQIAQDTALREPVDINTFLNAHFSTAEIEEILWQHLAELEKVNTLSVAQISKEWALEDRDWYVEQILKEKKND